MLSPELKRYTQYKELHDELAKPGISEDERTKLTEKIASLFADHTIHVQNPNQSIADMVIRAPEPASENREAFLESGVTFASPNVPDSMKSNAELLRKIVPADMLDDTATMVLLLESLYHCGNQHQLDNNPACTPSLILAELREYKAAKEQLAAQRQLDLLLHKNTTWSKLDKWIVRILDDLKKADQQRLRRLAEEQARRQALARGTTTTATGRAAAAAAAAPARARQEAPPLLPGFGVPLAPANVIRPITGFGVIPRPQRA